MENQKLSQMKFLPDVQEMPWGTMEYQVADLGFVDSMACEGWLKGNTLSDIMQTYLERVVGETSFEWYGTQFPVLVKRLVVKGRSSLHVNPDDENAGQRYDAFGKTALWYVEATGPQARLYLGFKRPVTATGFFQACQDGTAEKLLYAVKPKAGETYLIRPGLVHAAQDVTLLEVAEASELGFRLFDWGSREREMHLEEAFDLIDFAGKGGVHAGDVVTEQFTVHTFPLVQPLKSHRDEDDTFLLYLCVRGEALVQADGENYALKTGESLLVPAEVNGFFLLPAAPDTLLMEVRMDPRASNDIVSDETEE